MNFNASVVPKTITVVNTNVKRSVMITLLFIIIAREQFLPSYFCHIFMLQCSLYQSHKRLTSEEVNEEAIQANVAKTKRNV